MTDNDPLIAAIRQAADTIATANGVLAASVSLQGDDRTTRFLRRLDAWLAPMSAAGKRLFLTALLDCWERRYAAFICTAGDSDPKAPEGEPDASDYLLTICGISQRLAALETTERKS